MSRMECDYIPFQVSTMEIASSMSTSPPSTVLPGTRGKYSEPVLKATGQ